jgi:thiosulfate/3-mercaptopyruvate sulfurtransferase
MHTRTTLFLTAVAAGAALPASARTQTPDVLVSTEWLAGHLNDESLVLLHVGMGRENLPAAFIPGARFLDYRAIVTEVNGLSVEFPPAAELQRVFRSVGVSNDKHVVVYGSGAAHLAARVFVTLEYLGHRGKTSVLDGGFEMWQWEGRPTVPRPVEATPGSFVPRVRDDVLISAAEIVQSLDDPDFTLIDARPAAEYTGERIGRNPRGGHLPGAYNLYWEDLLISRDEPRLTNLDDVRARFQEARASQDGVVVSYCQIGMRASYTYLISRYLGYDARFYDGSWMDWAGRSELPAVQGPMRR